MVDLNNQFYPGQPLSLAMGVASCRSGDSVEAAIHRADQAMYAEKLRYYQDKSVDRRQPGRDGAD
jgi:GGDEF domain-containing protein